MPKPVEALPILTRSLKLRHFVPADAAAILALNAEPSTRRWLPSHVYGNLEEADAALAELIAWCTTPGDPRRAPHVLAVEESSTSRLIGHVGLSPLEGEVELSYAVAEDARGRGLGREALEAACRWAFTRFALPRLLAITATDNVASRRLLERCGFGHLGDESRRFQGEPTQVSRYVREAGTPGSTLVLTALDPGETEALVRMWRRSFEHGVGIVDPHPFEAQIAYFESQVRPHHHVHIARLDGEMVGFLACNRDSVSQLHVHVAHLRRGIGARLLERAKQDSGGRLWLYTFARNHNARRFYESRGFAAVAFGFEPTWQMEDVRYEWLRLA
jgi:RimJ/RimL family protein N-acetyltransferase